MHIRRSWRVPVRVCLDDDKDSLFVIENLWFVVFFYNTNDCFRESWRVDEPAWVLVAPRQIALRILRAASLQWSAFLCFFFLFMILILCFIFLIFVIMIWWHDYNFSKKPIYNISAIIIIIVVFNFSFLSFPGQSGNKELYLHSRTWRYERTQSEQLIVSESKIWIAKILKRKIVASFNLGYFSRMWWSGGWRLHRQVH